MKSVRITGNFSLEVKDNGNVENIPLVAVEASKIKRFNEPETLDIFGKGISDNPIFRNRLHLLETGVTCTKKDIAFDYNLLDGDEIVLKMYNTLIIGSEKNAWRGNDKISLQADDWLYGTVRAARELQNIHRKNQETFYKTFEYETDED